MKKSSKAKSKKSKSTPEAPRQIPVMSMVWHYGEKKVSFWQYVISLVFGGSLAALLDDAIFGFTPNSKYFHQVYENNQTWAGEAGYLLFLILVSLVSYGLFRLIGSINE